MQCDLTMQGQSLCLLVLRLVSVHSACVFQSLEKDIMARNDIAEKLRQEVDSVTASSLLIPLKRFTEMTSPPTVTFLECLLRIEKMGNQVEPLSVMSLPLQQTQNVSS